MNEHAETMSWSRGVGTGVKGPRNEPASWSAVGTHETIPEGEELLLFEISFE